jgi:tetratricopeptide (TPR) repeat protein
MGFDLFISYARKDNQPRKPGALGWISAFVDALQDQHRRVTLENFSIFFDRHEIRSGEDWELRIKEGVRGAKLMVTFISPNYFDSKWCRREWEAYSQHELNHSIGAEGIHSIYISSVPDFGGVPSGTKADWMTSLIRRQYLDMRQWFSLESAALHRDEACALVAGLDQQLAVCLDRVTRAQAAPGTVYRHNPTFIGRGDELRQIRHSLSGGEVGAITVVHGLPGIGKSALTTEYAHTFAGQYSGGRWQVDCDGEKEISIVLAKLATPLNVEFNIQEKFNPLLIAQRVLNELERRTQLPSLGRAERPNAHVLTGQPACLLILDNVNRSELLSPSQVDLLPNAPWLHVLVTTQLGKDKLFGTLPGREFLPLDELPEADALALMARFQSGGVFKNDAELEAARVIVQWFGGFTLAIEAVATFLGRFNELTFTGFLERLSKEGLAAEEAAASAPIVSESMRHREKQLTTALEPLLEQLAPEEMVALEYAAVLPENQIPMEWIEALMAKVFKQIQDAVPPGYPDPWEDILRRLNGLRLLRETGHPELRRMHPMVQKIVVLRMNSKFVDRRAQLIDHACHRAERLIWAKVDPQNSWELEPLNAFCTALLTEERLGGPRLALLLGKSLLKHGKFRETEVLLRRSVVCLESFCEPDDADLGLALSALGTALLDSDKFEEAEAVLRRSLAIAEKNFGAWHLNTACCLNNLGLTLYSTDRLTESESMIRRAVGICGRISEPNAETRYIAGRALNTLAVMLLNTSRSAEAEPFFQQALTLAEQDYENDPAFVATVLDNLAHMLMDANKLAEAESSIRRAIKIEGEFFDSNHVARGKSLLTLATILLSTNRLAEAEPLFREALRVHENYYGPEHPRITTDLESLALLLQATDRNAEAESLVRRAMAIKKARFGQNNLGVAIALAKLGTLLYEKGQLTEAEDLLRRSIDTQERLRGPEHRGVAFVITRLATVLKGAGRLDEAELLFRRALGIVEKNFPANHPEVGKHLNNLADVLFMMQKFTEAESLFQRVFAIDEQDNPDQAEVATHLYNFACLLHQTRRLPEAVQMWERSIQIRLKLKATGGRCSQKSLDNVITNYTYTRAQLGHSQKEIAMRINELEASARNSL